MGVAEILKDRRPDLVLSGVNRGSNIADDVIGYAQANNVTQIVIGKSARTRWFEIIHGSVVHDLVRRSGNISVNEVGGGTTAADLGILTPTGAGAGVSVIGSDVNSMMVDYTDRAVCVLFGDGAGAVILERCEDGEEGIMDFIHQVVDPYLNIFRRVIPPLGSGGFAIDISPILAIVVRGIVGRLVVSLIAA